MKDKNSNPIIVALDVDDVKKASQLVEILHSYVGGFKVGPRLLFRADKNFFSLLRQTQKIFFLDHKFFDIPSTTLASVEVAAELGADWVTVHALNGVECLEQLSSLESKIKKQNERFKILAVTVLTSFTEESLPIVWKKQSVSESVLQLAQQVSQCGLKSLVCSAQEIPVLKNAFPESFLVVPGIRLQGEASQDQKRVATPKAALRDGASALVIGRPLTASPNPVVVAQEILASL